MTEPLVERLCSCTGCTGHPGACGDVKPVTARQMATMRHPLLCSMCSLKLRSAKRGAIQLAPRSRVYYRYDAR
jgi:hypothetical protein